MTALADILAEQDGTRLLVWPPELLAGTGRERTPHLSATQINMARRCPEQFRRRYILGERRPPAGALIWGSADHAAHETNFRQKITTGIDISVDDVQLAFADAFDREVGRSGEVDWEGEKPGDLKDAGVALVAAYHKFASPRVQPVAVEERFEIAVPGVPVPVMGYMDVREAGNIVERKTAKAKSAQPNDEQRIQGLLYQTATRLPVHWHQSVKTKVPAVYTPEETPGLLLPFDERHVGQALLAVRTTARKIASLYAEFGPDEPWPDNAGHKWACWKCGYRPSCPWFAYEREEAA